MNFFQQKTRLFTLLLETQQLGSVGLLSGSGQYFPGTCSLN